MDEKNLKYVVAAKENEPAIIRFFDSVNEYSTDQFTDEFLWLQDYVKPSKIIVLINSEGGSVLHGMKVFSVINNSNIEVDCVIEGIAASMASVIWAAGDNLYMHDYSILMIHNPFCGSGSIDDYDEDTKNMITAFKNQLTVIYQKRFGLTKDEVASIMDGEGEANGTFMTAKEAVEKGFIDKSHIIKTSKAIREKVKNQIDGMADAASVKDVMASIANEDIEENKLIEKVFAIHNQTENKQQNSVMEKENISFSAVAAQLGFSAEADVASVSAKITALLNADNELKEVKASLATTKEELASVNAAFEECKIKLAGKEAEANNLNTELESAKASLKTYQDAEKAAKDAEIESIIDSAINEGKIDKESKESWIAMAQNNFEMVKNTLESIGGRKQLTQEIADDPANKDAAQAALDEAEKAVKAQVDAVVGKEFNLKKF